MNSASYKQTSNFKFYVINLIYHKNIIRLNI